jgi:hypothetical protein
MLVPQYICVRVRVESCRPTFTLKQYLGSLVRRFSAAKPAQPKLVKMNNSTLPAQMASLDLDIFQSSSATLGLGALLATFMSFLAFLSYTPRIDKRAPVFTKHTYPLIGAANFIWRKK